MKQTALRKNVCTDVLRRRFTPESGKKIAAAALAVFLVIFFHLLGITCPIKFLTGISCAGCGMTRAWIAAVHLDIQTALYYHPLFWIVPAAAVLYGLRRRIGRTAQKGCIAVISAAMIAVYIYRMVFGDGDIVVFEPENSIVYKAFYMIGGRL